MAARADRLRDYKAKRDFSRTPEPKGGPRKGGAKGKRKSARKLRYLIQKHDASRLHYDFRLEWNGTLMSWAVPKGPSEDRADKRLAVHVEDHPIEYGAFEGTIPKGEYGGGTVMLWDRGTWEPNQDVVEGLKNGKLSFQLHGKRLQGNWALVRLRARSPKDKDNWLLIKEHDAVDRKVGKLAVERDVTSVASGRTMAEIAKGSKVWHSNKPGRGATGEEPVILAGPGKAARQTKAAARPSRKSKTSTSRGSKKKPEGQSAPPRFVEPQLATLVDAPPPGADWVHEIKYDGYRAITSIGGGRVVMRTRKGLDWTDRFKPLVPALAALPCDSALLDGEIAVADGQGHTDFGALQDALAQGAGGFGYYLFDLLHLDGEDLRALPLTERKERLKALLPTNGGPLSYSDHVEGHGAEVFATARSLKLEGIISKLASAPYRSGRAKSWLKSKCGMEQEFVIIGWRPSDKPQRPFSSLLLGVRENGALRYAGRVGTGYTETRLDELAAKFKALARKEPPVKGVPPDIARRAKFIEPELVAEVEFAGWTRDGIVRQAAFKGLRADKPARDVVREEAMPERKAVTSAKAETKRKTTKRRTSGVRHAPREDVDEIAGVRVTHPDRVMFPDCGITKRDLIEHYLSIADAMLPHIAERPISLVRAPRGVGGQLFYQKHASDGFPDEFKSVKIKEKSGTDQYLYIEDKRGLVAAVQMSVLELHVWGSHVDDVEKPDRMVFDFDPDEGLDFTHVREAAREMRERLDDLGLESFPMVTGGKGVHVVVPLKRGHDWDTHRDFAEALARVMAADSPDRYVAVMSKARRKGKIFVDYLRNTRGATAICPFSSRSRKGAPVAVPVSWTQLGRMKDAHPVSVGEVKRFMGRRDPWPGYFKLKQALPKLKL